MGWYGADIDARGQRILVTGACTGLGLEVAQALVAAGAELVLACRDVARGRRVATELAPTGDLPVVVGLDPERAASARECVEELPPGAQHAVVHAQRLGTDPQPADAVRTELGRRHLVPFALTGLLLPRLVGSGAGRVVVVTDAPPPDRRFSFEAGLQTPPGMAPTDAAPRAALASLLATFELQRRFEAARLPVRCVACTPGTADPAPGWTGRLGASLARRRARRAILPVVVAAVAPGVVGGDWLGVGRRGDVVRLEPPPAARDVRLARRLVRHSEVATGVRVGPAT